MTALTHESSNRIDTTDLANTWLTKHHEQIVQRTRAMFGHFRAEAREEATSEVVAIITSAVHQAAKRGGLARLTPFWCVVFAGRHYRTGRRMAGYNANCVLSEACRVKHGVRVVPLSSVDEEADREVPIRLSESLADKDAEDPYDHVRQDHDYAYILDREQASEKARGTFQFLAETHGQGRQHDLACELKVTPARITQLKRELATALARHDYQGPLGRRKSTAEHG